MSHVPVNHPLRPMYRTLAVLAGAYLVIFGVVGLVQTVGSDAFSREDVWALGLRTNLAFAIASIVAGAVLVLAMVIGRNVDATVSLLGGPAFMAVGLAMLALLNSDLNVLNFSMATVLVSFAIGTLLFSAGLYTRSSH
jgi:hypothetical protein